MQLNWVFLLAASLASLAACEEVSFIQPPPFGMIDDGFRRFGNNQRYKQGEIVDVILSDVGNVGDLSVWQLKNVGIKKWDEVKLDVTKQSQLTKFKVPRRYKWTAVYDIGHYMQNGEDAVYWFEIGKRGSEMPAAKSAFFNVSMPNSGKSKPPAASKTTSLVRESSTSQSTTRPGHDSTATEKPSRKEKNRKEKNRKGKNRKEKNRKEKNRKEKNRKEKNRKEKQASARSGLTGGEVAGITIGAVVAFALILCGFCWGLNRMRVTKQLQKSHEFELRNMERDMRALRETVSKLGA